MLVKINGWVKERIGEFYKNAAKAYPSLNSKEASLKVQTELQKVGSGQLQKTTQTLPKWAEQGYTVEYSRNTKWYFAYKVENGNICVYGAEHNNNMSNNSFVANSNQKTDGNYNPQQQYVTDGKIRISRSLVERMVKNQIAKVLIENTIKRVSKIEERIKFL